MASAKKDMQSELVSLIVVMKSVQRGKEGNMGVYIKDREMPKECESCFLVEKCEQRHYEMMKDEDGYYMPILVKDNCPLVEITVPHGRLIDADKLFAIVKRHHDLCKGATIATDKARRDENLQVMFDIADAKTLMEAEK